MSAAIRLSPADNVAVACRAIVAGETIGIDGVSVAALEPVDLGHKIALSHLKAGEKIVKYGMPIGSATRDVPAGSWVHMHNMRSDYMPAHLRDASGDHS